MKKINKFLALIFLLCVGSIQAQFTYDRGGFIDFGYVHSKALCRVIMGYDIAILKKLIAPGAENIAIKFLVPAIEIDESVKAYTKSSVIEFDEELQKYLSRSTFLHFLINQMNPDTVKYLEASSNKAFVSLYQLKLVELIKYALEVGIDVHAQDINNNTALELASVYLQVDVVELLIQSGADINRHLSHGDTSLVTVVHNCLHAIVDTFYYDNKYFTEIDRSIKIIKIFIAAEADISVQSSLDVRDITIIDMINEVIQDFNDDIYNNEINENYYKEVSCSQSQIVYYNNLVSCKEQVEEFKNIIIQMIAERDMARDTQREIKDLQ